MGGKQTLTVSLALFALLLALSGCVTDTVPVRSEKSLGQNVLSRYNDLFDRFREDVWEKLGFIPGQEMREANFRLADVRIEDGRVRIETRTGGFSLGGLGSKFTIRGDFDVQIDCAVEFKSDVGDMEQLVQFHVANRTKELQDREIEVVNISILKPGKGEPRLFAGYLEKGKFTGGARRAMDGFEGSLRITREGDHITTLYRRAGEPNWQKLHTFKSFASDVGVGFKIQNFGGKRVYIAASAPFVAFFDNFRVNAAQEIIEPEI